MQRTLQGTPMRSQLALHPEEAILHFSVQGLLPASHTFALNSTLGTLCQIGVREDRPLMLMEQHFSASEVSVLVPLLESYPYYCPYEVLFASFTSGRVTESTVERCREHLQEALNERVWDDEMRPMRNVLSRTRLKTRSFGIEIASILETGYILTIGGDRKRKSAL